VPTDRPQIAAYVRPGYKAKIRQLAKINNPRRPSVSDTTAVLLEAAVDKLIEQGVLQPISEEDVLSDL
jgi:hypothetical protein